MAPRSSVTTPATPPSPSSPRAVTAHICAKRHERLIHYCATGCPLCVTLAELETAVTQLDEVTFHLQEFRERVDTLEAEARCAQDA